MQNTNCLPIGDAQQLWEYSLEPNKPQQPRVALLQRQFLSIHQNYICEEFLLKRSASGKVCSRMDVSLIHCVCPFDARSRNQTGVLSNNCSALLYLLLKETCNCTVINISPSTIIVSFRQTGSAHSRTQRTQGGDLREVRTPVCFQLPSNHKLLRLQIWN